MREGTPPLERGSKTGGVPKCGESGTTKSRNPHYTES
jgi:hypothetical protein